MKPKLLIDLEKCVSILSDEITDTAIRDTIGILRRCMVEYEGLDTIWLPGMTEFEKAKVMKARGFTFVKVYPYGLRINYLGYHLWGLTEEQIKELLS